MIEHLPIQALPFLLAWWLGTSAAEMKNGRN